MINTKYIFGQCVRYEGEVRRITGIRFTAGGVMYMLTGINDWVKEEILVR